MTLINIAPKATVEFSSKSKWSTPEDQNSLLTGNCARGYSFHSDLEQDPWIVVDLKKPYLIEQIVVFNRRDCVKFKAFQLEVRISTDKVNFELIHKGFMPFTDKAVFNLSGLKKARYIKLTAEGYTFFHLHKIEVLVDENDNDETSRLLAPSLCVGGGGDQSAQFRVVLYRIMQIYAAVSESFSGKAPQHEGNNPVSAQL